MTKMAIIMKTSSASTVQESTSHLSQETRKLATDKIMAMSIAIFSKYFDVYNTKF